jgi:hypothetical protein
MTRIKFSYCLDAQGNLIKLELDQHSNGLIPFKAQISATAAQLRNPVPWTVTIAKAVDEVRFVPSTWVRGTHAEPIHTKGEIPVSSYVYVPPVADYAEEATVMELITIFDQLVSDPDALAEVEAALAKIGIVRIPLLPIYNPCLHEPTTRTEEVRAYAASGWISNEKVYRKATIA